MILCSASESTFQRLGVLSPLLGAFAGQGMWQGQGPGCPLSMYLDRIVLHGVSTLMDRNGFFFSMTGLCR